ncbi:MAG TPA: hypothetical protein VMV46_20100 [Thermoanaerobaculia bacterium]|nr:hypothetical protein [Thermoanaerobaculia bacterium]
MADTQARQRAAVWVLLVFAAGTLLAGAGLVGIPRGPAWIAWLLHPVLLAVGFACGGSTVRRAREIEAERWRLVEDATLTRGERLYAHREAERETRIAGSIFLVAAISMGAFAAYVLRVPERIGVADLLILAPLFGFLAGLWVVSRRQPASPGPGQAPSD